MAMYEKNKLTIYFINSIKMASLKLFTFVLILLFIGMSCETTSKEILIENPCKTENILFTTDVIPILEAKCYYCHDKGVASSGGFNMAEFSEIQTRALSGKISGVINHADGFPKMPYGDDKLSDCNISIIEVWIDNGALED